MYKDLIKLANTDMLIQAIIVDAVLTKCEDIRTRTDYSPSIISLQALQEAASKMRESLNVLSTV